MLNMARTLTTLMALVFISSATIAAAQDQASAVASDGYQEHLDRGLAEYEAGHYEPAAEAFEAAYAVRPEPELQYNVARSYERAVKREEAIAAYQRFLELPGTTSETRTRALRAVASLRAEIEAMNASVPTEPEVSDPVVVVPPQEEPMPLDEPTSGRGAKATAGWVLIGTGALALVAGAISGGLALATNNEFEDATVREDQVALAQEVDNYALATDVLLGTGLVFAVVGIVLVAVDDGDDAEDDAQVRLTPAGSPTSVGLMLSGRL